MSDELVPGLRYASRAQELWVSVVAALASWEERINQVSAAAGLSPVSAWALVQLDPDHPISQKELAARLRCTPSTVVDPADRLEDAGLVDRRVDRADRRVNVLVVTARGRAVRDRLIAGLFEPPEAFRHLQAGEAARFRDVMFAVGAEAPPVDGESRTRRKPAAHV